MIGGDGDLTTGLQTQVFKESQEDMTPAGSLVKQ